MSTTTLKPIAKPSNEVTKPPDAIDEHRTFENWNSFQNVLQYLYLSRVPIVSWLGLFCFPFVARYVEPQLLGTVLVLTPGNIFWIGLGTVILSFAVLASLRVVLLNSEARFGVPQGLTRDVLSIGSLVIAESAGIPMWIMAVQGFGEAIDGRHMLARIGAVSAGIIAAHVIAFAVLLTSVWLSPRYQRPEKRFPLPFSWMENWISSAYDANLLSQERRTSLGNWAKELPKGLFDGYFDPETGLLYPGQWLSLIMLISSFVLYESIGLGHSYMGGTSGVPAIAYLILLLIFLNWILAIGAFFLDRYRFPLLVALGLLIFASNATLRSDHFYETRPAQITSAATPAQVLTSPTRTFPTPTRPRGRVVVVATAGGGIQAAAWTARVLTGLHEELKNISGEGTDFANSIAAISSVSGGAVGTMFFANEYGITASQRGYKAADSASVVRMAEEPALDEIAWGMLYPDFSRIVFPYVKTSSTRLIDRGWALEDAWRRRANLSATLGDWQPGVAEGWRPTVMFNATVVESGEPLVFANADLKSSKPDELGRRTLAQFLPARDVPVVTAVRLAATFPYVTPASRALLAQSGVPDLDPKKRDDLQRNATYHVVDGGYYDNYGVNTLLAWLDEALKALPPDHIPDILLIQIRSFPSEGGTPPSESRGWSYQTYAPASALMQVRTTGQLVRDREAIDLFQERWRARGVHIQPVTFEFKGDAAPLSWKMAVNQKGQIESEWVKRISGPDNQDWGKVACFFQPLSSVCRKAGTIEKSAW